MIKYSKISNYQLKKIIKHFCVDIDATRTSKLIGLNRETINRYFLLFREAIYQNQKEISEKLFGKVEFDESYFGAKRVRGYHGKLKRGRGTTKQPVFGIFQRDGKVYTEIVPDCKKATLQAIIKGKVEAKTEVYTDSWRGYDGLVDVGFDKHFRVNHGKNEFALKGENDQQIHVNGIEGFWSFCKRRLAKFNGYKKNFELHLKECEWRWNFENESEMEKNLTSILKKFLI
jgi:transposase